MRFDGFGKMCLVAGSCGFYLVFRTYKRSERNSGYLSAVVCGESPDFAYKLVSILARHAYIAYYDIGLMFPYELEPFVSARSADYLRFMCC